jgi:hypothetical protein
MLDLESGKITDFIKFDLGNLAMVTGGHNNGRVGTIVHKEKHKGGHDIVHIEDAAGNRCGNAGNLHVCATALCALCCKQGLRHMPPSRLGVNAAPLTSLLHPPTPCL